MPPWLLLRYLTVRDAQNGAKRGGKSLRWCAASRRLADTLYCLHGVSAVASYNSNALSSYLPVLLFIACSLMGITSILLFARCVVNLL